MQQPRLRYLFPKVIDLNQPVWSQSNLSRRLNVAVQVREFFAPKQSNPPIMKYNVSTSSSLKLADQ
jgi:hypothetical protein